jgi:preprotein translocase subunit SecD
MVGYEFPGIGSPIPATVIAGLIGMVAVFGLSVVVARILIPRTPE